MTTEEDRVVAYYETLAERYDEEVTGNPRDRLVRRAFRELVRGHVDPGSVVLDFGSGTGLDAEWYAAQGYRVLAFDNSEAMMAVCRARCARVIAEGRVATAVRPYPSLATTLREWPAPHAVVSNFAVLNMVEDPAAFFELVARYAAPPAWLIVSVVNPWQWPRVAEPAWWWKYLAHRRGRWRLGFTDRFTTYAHFVGELARSARQFDVMGVANAGRCVRYRSRSPGSHADRWWGPAEAELPVRHRLVWHSPLWRLAGTFTFLVLRRK
jgi:SAM-dependent methyltransferase